MTSDFCSQWWVSGTAQRRNEEEGGEGLSVGLCYVPAGGLTGKEYMAFIDFLKSIVAVTKMDSVADSDFPLVRKSLTYKRSKKNELTR